MYLRVRFVKVFLSQQQEFFVLLHFFFCQVVVIIIIIVVVAVVSRGFGGGSVYNDANVMAYAYGITTTTFISPNHRSF